MKPNKVTVIIGPQGSGKSTMARKMAKKRNAVWVYECVRNESNAQWAVRRALAEEKCDLIIIEDVTKVEVVKMLATLKAVKVRRPYSPLSTIVRVPDLIIISQTLKASDLKGRRGITVIEPKGKVPTKWYSQKVYRSAKTGRFIKSRVAKRWPSTTYQDTLFIKR